MRVNGSIVALAIAALTLSVPAAPRMPIARSRAAGSRSRAGRGRSTRVPPRRARPSTTPSSRRRTARFHIFAGSPSTYWNPANVGQGRLHGERDLHRAEDVRRTSAPVRHLHRRHRARHETPTYAYCVAYGNGDALVRGFSKGQVVNYFKRQPHAAVAKAAAGAPVTQTIAWTVKGDKAECSINGRSWPASTRPTSSATARWLPPTASTGSAPPTTSTSSSRASARSSTVEAAGAGIHKGCLSPVRGRPLLTEPNLSGPSSRAG